MELSLCVRIVVSNEGFFVIQKGGKEVAGSSDIVDGVS
jgi:hypothetical protein